MLCTGGTPVPPGDGRVHTAHHDLSPGKALGAPLMSDKPRRDTRGRVSYTNIP